MLSEDLRPETVDIRPEAEDSRTKAYGLKPYSVYGLSPYVFDLESSTTGLRSPAFGVRYSV